MFEEPAYQWRDATWREAAESWIVATADQLGNPVTGPIAGVRFLPWSAVLRAPGARGDLYFKACGPSQRHEPGLAALLADLYTDLFIPILATDLERGWMLMPDGGPTLMPVISTPDEGPPHWRRVLDLIASVQRDLVARTSDFLAIGVPDRRPSELPRLLDSLLRKPDRLLVGETGALEQADLGRLEALGSRISELCDELVAIGPPDTYIQDDLNEGHIFTSQDARGFWRYQLFDHGDAVIAHPFFQLVSQPRFIVHRYSAEEDMIKLSLYESYITRWEDYASTTHLHRARRIAHALGGIMRALTWTNACQEILDELSPALRDFYKDGTAHWLRQVVLRVERLDAA